MGEAQALLLAFDQDAGYDNFNLLWFRERYDRFVYIDRIVIDAQQRAGIAMLLHGAASSRQTGVSVIKRQLQVIVGQINHVVGSARDLARWLSPLGVARGSLGAHCVAS